MSEQYEGFKNRETWAAALLIQNDEKLNDAVYHTYKNSSGIRDFKDRLEKTMEKIQMEATNKHLGRDLMMAIFDIGSFWRIDYRELAEHLSQIYSEY